MSGDVLSLDVLHEAFPGRRWAELRFAKKLTVQQVKEKLQMTTGTSPETMEVYVIDDNNPGSNKPLLDDSRTLADLQIASGSTLMVIDTDRNSIATALGKSLTGEGQQVEKYRMSDEEYNKKDNSARQFISNLRRSRPELFQPGASGGPNISLEEAKAKYPVGSRCEVGGRGGMRGEVAFVGRRGSSSGDNSRSVWVGVKLDEPLGDTDGRLGSMPPSTDSSPIAGVKKAFEASGPRGGLWVDLGADGGITIGDYPPVNPFDSPDGQS